MWLRGLIFQAQHIIDCTAGSCSMPLLLSFSKLPTGRDCHLSPSFWHSTWRERSVQWMCVEWPVGRPQPQITSQIQGICPSNLSGPPTNCTVLLSPSWRPTATLRKRRHKNHLDWSQMESYIVKSYLPQVHPTNSGVIPHLDLRK